MSQASAFLRDLFGDPLPDSLRVALWTKAGKRTDVLDDVAGADDFEGRADVYVNVALLNGRMSGARPTAADAAAIPGVWADIDVAGGPEDKPGKKSAPDRETAIAIAKSIRKPTILVNSGYGIQAWWLFEDPWRMRSDDDRAQAARVTEAWQRLLEAKAAKKGVKLDAVHDLARLMRLPGTLNDKGPTGTTAPVEILQDDGPRYDFEQIAELAIAAAPPIEPRPTVGPGAEFPQAKFDALLDNHELFRMTWHHSRRPKEVAGWSMSEYDQSLANVAVNAGWTDGEVAALIARHRLERDPTDAKARRRDYLSLTIATAREGERAEQARREVERSVSSIDLINQTLRLPSQLQVTGVIEHGEAGAETYDLVVSDGPPIGLGGAGAVWDPRKWDQRVAPRVLPLLADGEDWPYLKPLEFQPVAKAVFRIARRAAVSTTSEQRTREWLDNFVKAPTERHGFEGASAPLNVDYADKVHLFELLSVDEPVFGTRDGRLFVRVRYFRTFVSHHEEEKLGDAEIRRRLMALGFEKAGDNREGKVTAHADGESVTRAFLVSRAGFWTEP